MSDELFVDEKHILCSLHLNDDFGKKKTELYYLINEWSKKISGGKDDTFAQVP